jgi:exopolysaccharide biosynthesis polyprenyl glycosylphosphotransferase
MHAPLSSRKSGSEPTTDGIDPPAGDIRTALDAAVRRSWSEQSRRVARVLSLLFVDTVAGLAAVAVVRNTWWLVSGGGARPVPDTIPLVAMICCIQPLALRATGAYGGGRSRMSGGRIALAILLAGLAGWIQTRLFGQITPALPNKTAYVYSVALIAAFVSLGRLAFDRVVKVGFRAGLLQRHVLLVAHQDELERVERRLRQNPASDVRIACALSPHHLADGMQALDDAIAISRVHAVVVSTSLPGEMLDGLVRCCFMNGVGISLLPLDLNFRSAYPELRQSDMGVLLQLFPVRLGVPQMALKRAVDIALTLAALGLGWPLLAAVAVAIKLDSRGPVFFCQERIGVGGKPFRMIKFRTMRDGADALKKDLVDLNESKDPRLFKIRKDPRVTRVGRWLRRLSLDEFPQLINVLRGEMSLVGPRPFFAQDLEMYDRHHFARLHVLPGITGLWQVSGRSDVVDFEEVVRLDLEYVRNWSVLSDLRILAQTVPAVFGRGAY